LERAVSNRTTLLLAGGTSSRHDGAMWRYLRLSAAAGLMLAAGALLALWPRSYWHSDSVFVRVSTRSFRANSSEGSLHGVVNLWGARSLLDGEPRIAGRWRTRELKSASGPPAPNKLNPLWLLNLQHAGDTWYVNVPHWLLALLAGVVGMALWRGTRRFTLRTMLALTAIVALMAAMAGRS
jgi:hypothetical protein